MAGARRSIPLNPYASETVETWRERLARETGLENRYRAFVALTQLQPPAQAWPDVATALKDSEGDIKAASAYWLATGLERHTFTTNDVPVELITALEGRVLDEDPDVQLAAANALSWLKPTSPSLVPLIVGLLQRDDLLPGSQSLLAQLCGRLPAAGTQALDRLRAFLQSAEQAEVREAAAQALVRLGPVALPALPELLQGTTDEEPLVRELSAVALGQLGQSTVEVLSALEVAAADEDTQVAEAAQKALSTLRREPRPQ